jgi:osmoprotectant transport system ATP-binding protein
LDRCDAVKQPAYGTLRRRPAPAWGGGTSHSLGQAAGVAAGLHGLRCLEIAGVLDGRAGATVEFRHVTATYRSGTDRLGTTVVDDLSLLISPGEICVLVGPSGCGKTTTLRLVNRLVEPASGRILIDGNDVTSVDPVQLRRRIGYVIQQIGLFPHQTVAQNVATVPRLLGWPAERIRQRVDELLALVGLDPPRLRDRYPAQLSGGERQRVGVARAMAAEPPLMLMDEPFGAVDPIVRERLQDEFLRLQQTLGVTVLFVTHDVDEAIKMGTKIAVFRPNGRLAQYSSPMELLTRPADAYVARFVGADRALKRLALLTVGETRWESATSGMAPAGGTAPAGAPRLTPEMTLRDALAAILAAPQQAGIVLDERGQARAIVTPSAIAAAVQQTIAMEPAA